MFEYMILITFFLFFIPMVYIKIKYPFWSHQPVFHNYDIFRYWVKNPYIIQNGLPLKTKYLNYNTQTFEFLDVNDEILNNIVHFIQSHYIESDKVLTMISKNYIHNQMIGY